jgi:hypothetical protein
MQNRQEDKELTWYCPWCKLELTGCEDGCTHVDANAAWHLHECEYYVGAVHPIPCMNNIPISSDTLALAYIKDLKRSIKENSHALLVACERMGVNPDLDVIPSSDELEWKPDHSEPLSFITSYKDIFCTLRGLYNGKEWCVIAINSDWEKLGHVNIRDNYTDQLSVESVMATAAVWFTHLVDSMVDKNV